MGEKALMIPIARPLIGAEEEAAALRVLASGRLAQGERVAPLSGALPSYAMYKKLCCFVRDSRATSCFAGT